jgi:hypothetical protein
VESDHSDGNDGVRLPVPVLLRVPRFGATPASSGSVVPPAGRSAQPVVRPVLELPAEIAAGEMPLPQAQQAVEQPAMRAPAAEAPEAIDAMPRRRPRRKVRLVLAGLMLAGFLVAGALYLGNSWRSQPIDHSVAQSPPAMGNEGSGEEAEETLPPEEVERPLPPVHKEEVRPHVAEKPREPAPTVPPPASKGQAAPPKNLDLSWPPAPAPVVPSPPTARLAPIIVPIEEQSP